MRQDAENAFLIPRGKYLVTCLIALVHWQYALSQGDIPVGTWRTHGNYIQPIQLAGAGSTVFVLGENSLFFVSQTNPAPTPLSYQEGLYGQAFSRIAYHPTSKTLVVTYTDGTLELIGETRVRRINELRNNALITQKRINQIVLSGDIGWLAADFGIAAVSVVEGFVQRAFINLGPGGTPLPISGLAVMGDNIYALSEQGILLGDLNANLNDFNQWTKLPPAGSFGFNKIHALNETVYLVGNDQQLYQLQGNTVEWIAGTFGVGVSKLVEDRLVFQMGNQFYEIGPSGNMQPIPFFTDLPLVDFHLSGESLYLAVPGVGLWKLPDSKSLTPNGIQSVSPFFYSGGSEIFAFEEWGSIVDRFSQGTWETLQSPVNITSIAQVRDALFIGTQSGIFRFSDGEFTAVDLSPLPSSIGIQAMSVDARENLYLVTGGVDARLLQLDANGTINTLEVSGLGAVKKMVVDGSGNNWIMEQPVAGGRNLRVVNPIAGLDRTFGNTFGQGGLPSNTVQDIFLDQDENLWVATSQGLGYFFNTRLLSQSSSLNAILPIFQNRQVLANTSVTQLIVSPDRSVWAATANQGIWQFGEGFEEVLHHFTTTNSPLPSQRIHSIALNKRNGELFIGTAMGAVSFRSGSIQAAEKLEAIKIYPNPVHPQFSGVLSIEGLTDFAVLKISHSSGRVVYTTRVAGGKVTWDMRTDDGSRLSPGVYMVYVLDANGRERSGGKFLIM